MRKRTLKAEDTRVACSRFARHDVINPCFPAYKQFHIHAPPTSPSVRKIIPKDLSLSILMTR